jgi:RNA polymerase-interacting CarD/CdnL/TRCF family regulator
VGASFNPGSTVLPEDASCSRGAVTITYGSKWKDEGAAMEFHIGDKVVHKAYGVGEILQYDEKTLYGRVETYYVVQIKDLTIWVPVNGNGDGSLRPTTPASEFEQLFKILSKSGEALSDDRLERRTELIDRLRRGTLESMCRIIRDLMYLRRVKKLNDHDSSVLARAQNLLVEEWELALAVPHAEAERELMRILATSK